MTKELKHSELPFKADSEACILDAQGSMIAAIEDTYHSERVRPRDKDAQYIVKACNAYPELIELLKEAETELENLVCGRGDYGLGRIVGKNTGKICDNILNLLKLLEEEGD